MATVNLGLCDSDRDALRELTTRGTVVYTSHLFSLLVNGLSKLGEFELMVDLLFSVDRRKIMTCSSMTQQGGDMVLMAIANLRDLTLPGEELHRLLTMWINDLWAIVGKPKSVQSETQRRIVAVLLGDKRRLGERMEYVTNRFTTISSLHSKVMDTLDCIGIKTQANIVDESTGYEIDIVCI